MGVDPIHNVRLLEHTLSQYVKRRHCRGQNSVQTNTEMKPRSTTLPAAYITSRSSPKRASGGRIPLHLSAGLCRHCCGLQRVLVACGP